MLVSFLSIFKGYVVSPVPYFFAHTMSFHSGASPSALEWLLFLWVLGKWKQEVQECFNRGFKTYVCDWWNYNDILQLLLFSVCFALRFVKKC